MTLISWLSNDRHSTATESCAAEAFEKPATGCCNVFVLSTCKMRRRQPKWGGHFYDNGPLSHTAMALLDVFMYWPSQWACLCVHWSIGSPNLCTDRTQSGELLGGRPPIFTGRFPLIYGAPIFNCSSTRLWKEKWNSPFWIDPSGGQSDPQSSSFFKFFKQFSCWIVKRPYKAMMSGYLRICGAVFRFFSKIKIKQIFHWFWNGTLFTDPDYISFVSQLEIDVIVLEQRGRGYQQLGHPRFAVSKRLQQPKHNPSEIFQF